MGKEGRRVLVLGLDSAPPQYIFGPWMDELPNLKRLMLGGSFGEIKSSIPPITIPAWLTMVTGKNPGRLGVYGFRNRKGFDYFAGKIASADQVKEERIWDVMGRAGKKVCLVGIPPTYPPRPVNGNMITCFLTPDTNVQYTFPAELRAEIKQVLGGGDYAVDVDEFRTENKDWLLKQIYQMTEKRWKVLRYLAQNKEWDFFMVVEIGVDRIQHGFWKYFDETHRKFEPYNPFRSAVLDYYRYLDREIGELLKLVDKDTVVIVVSDHGAKKMEGCININDWMIQEGYLKLKGTPATVVRLKDADVDWARTTAWGLGGYYGRVFLNVKGREPQGIVDPVDYERIRNEISEKLIALKDDRGNYMDTRAIRPQDVFNGPYVNDAPDLFVYFGNLYWRSTEDIGHPGIYSFDTEVGPDDAVHDEYGIFILNDPWTKGGKRLNRMNLMDVAPTILNLMGVPIPEDVEGRIIEA